MAKLTSIESLTFPHGTVLSFWIRRQPKAVIGTNVQLVPYPTKRVPPGWAHIIGGHQQETRALARRAPSPRWSNSTSSLASRLSKDSHLSRFPLISI